ncbi:hypothetical protein VNO77_23619 [Canavalia gladiata]|uniref:Uncharacterized protein n=1 Tax=Canavalia gladiata TaxID=3824 RepID=A0AAN9Q938_CANGL
MIGERHQQQEGGDAPHGILVAIVVSIVVVGPFLVGETLTETISEFLSPMGLLLLPILLLLTVHFISSHQDSFIFSTGEPNTIHRLSGSPLGVALFLILILFLLYNRISIFHHYDSAH